MQQIRLGKSELKSSRLAYGCMRIVGDGSAFDRKKGKQAVHSAIDAGYTLFDHADIYADGACEKLFGEILIESPSLRKQIVIASKCGIRFAGHPGTDDPSRYDFAAEHLLASVDNSLRRLGIETLDMLLLHRPDYLMDAQSVAATFERLQSAGKVAHFGVSNFSASQVELLQSALTQPLLVNQIEINIYNVSSLDDGTLDQCQRLGITPQAWGPVAGIVRARRLNTFTADDEARINKELQRQAVIYRAEPSQIALAWLLRHPAGVSPIIGTTDPKRIAAAADALDIGYAHADWYRLFEARNGSPVP